MSRLADVLLQGTHAARPAAAAGNQAYLYYETDTQILFQSTGSAWTQIAAAASITSGGVVANAGGAPSLEVGVDASKPAAGTAGRLYVATDTGNLYEDSGSAWGVVATVQWANLTGKPSTFTPSAHESSHLSGGSDPLAAVAQTQIDVDATEAATNDSLSGGNLRTNMRRIRYQLAQLGTGAWNTLVAMVQLSPGSQQSGSINIDGEIQGRDFKPGGVTGATAAARYHAATATGHPTTGTWAVGDIVPDQTGTFWFCTVAGTPGTWVQVGGTGGGGGGSGTLAGDTDVSISSPVGGQVLGYSDALSKWVNQNQAGVAATTSTAQLGADVTMTAANTFYDGPSVALSPGTWLLVGAVKVLNVYAGNDYIEAKLWDGTTVFASGEFALSTVISDVVIPFSAIVTPTTATTYKISCASTGTNNVIKAALEANAAGNTATYLRAIQLSGNPVGQQAPAVRCYNSANISIPNATVTALTFDTNRFDQGTSTSQHSTSTNTSRLTCQQAGVYQISGVARYAANTTGVERDLSIRINGSTYIAQDARNPATGGLITELVVTTEYYLNVGDYVELLAYQDSGGALNVVASANISPEFMMARIDSGPGAVQPNTKVQLSYIADTDLISGSLTNGAWTDIGTNQTFTIDDPNSVVEVSVSGTIQVTQTTGTDFRARIIVDSAGTPITRYLGGCYGSAQNLLSGTSPQVLTGLTAGTHTIKVQAHVDATGAIAYCRAGTYPDIEGLSIFILERKQSVSPPSSTPAPAVRCSNSSGISPTNNTEVALTFDTNDYDQGTSMPQHSTSSNTSRLVCQQSGIYLVTGCLSWSGSPGSSQTDVIIKKNGTTTLTAWTNVGTDQRVMFISAQEYLNVGDYLELRVYQNNSLTVQYVASQSPVFAMTRIDTGGTGAVYVPVVKTADYTATASDSMIVAGANGLTITLPAASAYGGKAPFVVKNDAFTGTTVAAAGSDTIDGASTFSLSNAQASVSLVPDTSSGKWRVI